MDMAVRRISKILIAGPVGVGKTTAVTAVSDAPIVTTEARPTDDTRLLKETTTVALDFGVLQLDNNHAIHLYGMPGQQRFDFMWKFSQKAAPESSCYSMPDSRMSSKICNSILMHLCRWSVRAGWPLVSRE